MVFAKAPQPGAVKTRLVPALGEQGAAALHARLVKRTLAVARAAAIGPIELHCAPDSGDSFLQFCGSRYRAALMTQAAGDLGERMLAAFECALATAPRAILLGTDCPALSLHHLRKADRVLREGLNAVFIPTEDGGYALIGLTRCSAHIFDGICWGESTVMAETRKKLAALRWRWRELEMLWDVDRPEDYERLVASRLLEGQRVTA